MLVAQANPQQLAHARWVLI